MCCFWVEALKSHLPFPVPPRTVKFQKKDGPGSRVSKRRQHRAEPPADADGMYHEQERNPCCFCHWDFWSFLLLQQNLAYPNLPEIKTIWIQDSNSGLWTPRPMRLVAPYRYPSCLLLRRHPVNVTSSGENWPSYCSYPWLGKKLIFFSPHRCRKKILWAKVNGR